MPDRPHKGWEFTPDCRVEFRKLADEVHKMEAHYQRRLPVVMQKKLAVRSKRRHRKRLHMITKHYV